MRVSAALAMWKSYIQLQRPDYIPGGLTSRLTSWCIPEIFMGLHYCADDIHSVQNLLQTAAQTR